MKYKIKWTVGAAPTGKYRSFEKRAWPSADYQDAKESSCAMIQCEDRYEPSMAKTGNHKELTVYIADYSAPTIAAKGRWTWRALKKRCTTLQEAKDLVQDFLEKNPTFQPE